MSSKNEKAQKNAQVTNTAEQTAKSNAAKFVAGVKYADRLRAISGFAGSPSKTVKNAFETAKAFALYSAAVQALQDANKVTTKNAVQYLCSRYKSTPRKYSEYYVHQYLQRAIKENLYIAACRNYYINEKVEKENANTAAK